MPHGHASVFAPRSSLQLYVAWASACPQLRPGPQPARPIRHSLLWRIASASQARRLPLAP
eukprot:10586413-Alexandrium_andersonii.AAC.1